MKKETKIGIALSATMAASGCATHNQQPYVNEAISSESQIRSVVATATNVKTGQTKEIAPQPVNGREACVKFADAISSAGFDVSVNCINGRDGTGRVISGYKVEYEEPSETKAQEIPAP